MQELTEIKALISKLSNTPLHWSEIKEFLFIGLLSTWNKDPEEAEPIATLISEYIVNEKLMKNGFAIPSPLQKENLIKVLKNSILLHDKNLKFFQNILSTSNMRNILIKYYLDECEKEYKFILNKSNVSLEVFLESFNKNKKTLNNWLDSRGNIIVNTHSDSRKKIFDILARDIPQIFLFIFCLSYAILTLMSIGNPLLIAFFFSTSVSIIQARSIGKILTEDIQNALASIKLELKSPPQPRSRSKTNRPPLQQNSVYLEMTPVSYLPPPKPVPSQTNNKDPNRKRSNRKKNIQENLHTKNSYTHILHQYNLTERQKKEGILALDADSPSKAYFKFGIYEEMITTQIGKKLNNGVFERGLIEPTGKFNGFKHLSNLKRYEFKFFDGRRLEYEETGSTKIADNEGKIHQVPIWEPVRFYEK